MRAALHAIGLDELQSYTLAYHWCTAQAAERYCTHGLDAGALITTLSPAELGWQKYQGGRFKDTAGKMLWGTDWQHKHAHDLQAVVILAIPLRVVTDTKQSQIRIPDNLMTRSDDSVMVYSNAFVRKIYVLETHPTCLAESMKADQAEHSPSQGSIAGESNPTGYNSKAKANDELKPGGPTAFDGGGDLELSSSIKARLANLSFGLDHRDMSDRNQEGGELREAFDIFDADGSGQINASELRIALRALGYSPSRVELEQLLHAADTDMSGEIGFEEFTAMCDVLPCLSGSIQTSTGRRKNLLPPPRLPSSPVLVTVAPPSKLPRQSLVVTGRSFENPLALPQESSWWQGDTRRSSGPEIDV